MKQVSHMREIDGKLKKKERGNMDERDKMEIKTTLNLVEKSVRLAGFNSQSDAQPGLRDYSFRAVQAISLF